MYSLGFFHPVLLFGPVRLLFFQNFPPPTFIRPLTFIMHFRVPAFGFEIKHHVLAAILNKGHSEIVAALGIFYKLFKEVAEIYK